MTVPGLDLGDRDDDSPSAAEVVDVPGTTADEHEISGMSKTVAQVSSEYPAGDRVVGVRFGTSGPTYHYPASRLKKVGDEWEPAGDAGKSDGRRERERIFSDYTEGVRSFVAIARHLLIRQETAARDTIHQITLDDDATDYVANAEAVFEGMLAPGIGSGPDPTPGPEMTDVETRGECSNAREDEYRPNVSGAICCWECSDQPNNRPEKFHVDDDAGPLCVAVGTSPWDRKRKIRQKLAELVTVSIGDDDAIEVLDTQRLMQDIARFRGAVATGDDGTVRRQGIRIAYRHSLGHVEEYNYHRALAVLRDHDAAHDLPIVDDGSADPVDAIRTVPEYGTAVNPRADENGGKRQ